MSIQEENFKICGLCSQLVDESVVNNETLRSFLGELLNVSEDSLPTKTCMECYKVCSDSELQNILRFLKAKRSSKPIIIPLTPSRLRKFKTKKTVQVITLD